MKIISYIEILNQQTYSLIPKGKNKYQTFRKSASIIVYREIKIADFGTSRRLTGLKLCTGEIVGKFQLIESKRKRFCIKT